MAPLSSDAALLDPRPFARPGRDGLVHLDLLVQGAHCAACIKRIETGARQVEGVVAARMNLSTAKLAVAWRGADADPRAVVARLVEMGFGVAPFDSVAAKSEADQEERFLLKCLIVSGVASLTLMHLAVWSWAGADSGDMGAGTRGVLHWLMAAIAIPATLYGGRPFFRSAIAALRVGRANMDVPISIALILTLAVSVQETILGGIHAYYDAAVMLSALLLIGRYLDHRLRRRARAAASDLLALQAQTAARIDPRTGHVEPVKASDVRAGDLILLMPGDRVPADGVVEEGGASVDRSLVTGESAAQTASARDVLHAGVLVLDGRLTLRATAAAADSLVADLTRLIEAGEQGRAAYVRLADKAARLYVPVVHLLALATALIWLIIWDSTLREAILAATAVLIVTCPCALGLAVPAVQIVATGRLFKRGVLVKSGDALERLAEAEIAVFDKTGTLTLGRPQLLDVDRIPKATLAAAATLARASRHPLSRAVAWAAGPGTVAGDAVETQGQGVAGTVDGRPARLGRAGFAGAPEGAGAETELWFRFGDEHPVRFAFEDRLRADARDAVIGLRDRGLGVEMLSGDLRRPAMAMADAAGIDRVTAEASPQDKIDRLAALKADGARR